MVVALRPTDQTQTTWATFTPDEFGGRRADAPTRRFLTSVTRINDLLLAPGTQHELFTSIAEVCAQALSYPFVSILLFDDDLEQVEVAGISNHNINLLADRLAHRRIPNLLYRPIFPISDLQDKGWL